MVTFEKARSLAEGRIDKVEVCWEFENFYVFLWDPEIEMDSSVNMVAVEKETGRCCNFVSVIPRLGEKIGRYPAFA